MYFPLDGFTKSKISFLMFSGSWSSSASLIDWLCSKTVWHHLDITVPVSLRLCSISNTLKKYLHETALDGLFHAPFHVVGLDTGCSCQQGRCLHMWKGVPAGCRLPAMLPRKQKVHELLKTHG